jgi:hypothetical protein
MLKMSAKPSGFSIVKPCSRFACEAIAPPTRRRLHLKKKAPKQKRPVRFFQTGRFEIKRSSDYGAGYKIWFAVEDIQPITGGTAAGFPLMATKISVGAA